MGKDKITNYFKKIPNNSKQVTPTKPSSTFLPKEKENDRNEMNITPNAKRCRIDSSETESGISNCSPVLSPDQRERMLMKKTEAKIIKMSKNSIISRKIGFSWFQALEQEFEKPYFKLLSSFIMEERIKFTIFPNHDDVWSWTQHTPIQDIRVVILGQDPYHGPGQAHGLCFSVQPGVVAPPSLMNMYKELETDIPAFTRPQGRSGYLAGWADQGVLLLNAVLTVRSGNANSHKDKGWEKLTDAVIKWISDNCDGVVFLLWGAYAQKKASVVDKSKHHLLKSVHPSPLSAHRGFLGCKHFSQCNALLKSMKKEEIDWAILPQSN